ncbi:MAG TPA: diaminopimelate decarboxylase [Acidimicrobiia bacterium]
MSALSWDLLPDTAGVDEDGHLMIGGCDLVQLAVEHGTPLFVYDEAHIRNRCREAVAAFGAGAVYASKAFLCRAMARLAHDEGMAIDVSTAGELHVCLEAGVPADRLVFHGNNKSRNELRRALEAGVGRIVVDSFDELDRLQSLHESGRTPPRILLRVTPGVEAHTHDFVSTGQDDSKFGFTVSSGAAARAVVEAMQSTAVDLVGIHAHIGSQVFRVESFAEALGVVAGFARDLDLPELSIGGGLGVAYVEGEVAPSITEWAEAIKGAAAALGVTSNLFAEPGRAIVAQAAITLYTVGTIKDLPGIRTYVAVDGGMSDNPRPILYGSGYETFVPARVNDDRQAKIRLVGKHCESGDVLVLDGTVPEGLGVGDFIATPVTGAYGHSMGSNYNKILRPAVLFASGGKARLVVRRETLDDLLLTDLG